MLFKGLIVKIVKRKWGAVLPMLFRAVAEGQFGEVPKKIYWLLAERKTFIGAMFLAVGAGLEQLAASFPADFPWAAGAARTLYIVGGFLASVGLVDGGVRAPWPSQAPPLKDPDIPKP